jgi:hypothetical protein
MTLFLFSTIFLVFEGCKKYEQGPSISFRSKKSRVAGDWVVTSYSWGYSNWSYKSYGSEYNMCNGGGSILCNTFYQINSFLMSFDKDGSYSWERKTTFSDTDITETWNTCTACYDTITNNESYSGKWHFTSKKSEIEITNYILDPFYDPNSQHNYGIDLKSMTWEIIELREKHMELRNYYGNTLILLILDKK